MCPHYHIDSARQSILKKKEAKGYEFPKHEHRVIGFVNLAIHPYDWEQVYISVRKEERISYTNWEALKGVILALLVLTKRKNRESMKAVDAYILDFIELMKSDRQGDPEKFLLNMKWYMPRFQFVIGLKVAFGFDWREVVVSVLNLSHKPQPTTYGSLFVNGYLRTLLYAFIIFKTYRQADEEDYELGVNDINSLVDSYSKKYYCHSRESLVRLLVFLQENLPSYAYRVRRQAAYAIDNAFDGWNIVNKSTYTFSKKYTKAEIEVQEEKENDYLSKLADLAEDIENA